MKKRVFAVVYMFLLTLFFTSLVSAVRLLSEEKIEANQRVKLERIILQVLGVSSATKSSDEDLGEIVELPSLGATYDSAELVFVDSEVDAWLYPPSWSEAKGHSDSGGYSFDEFLRLPEGSDEFLWNYN